MACLAMVVPVSCADEGGGNESPRPDLELPELTLCQTARLLSELPLRKEQMQEVYDAVNSSSSNGYDEEYMMRDLFASPGSGVGSEVGETRSSRYAKPLRDLIHEHLSNSSATRAGTGGMDADAVMMALERSEMQIYWPNYECWDEKTLPVISFDPGTEAVVNEGYELELSPDGEMSVNEILVDEQMASERPVWIINTNDDSAYTSLEKLRRKDPEWGKGGTIIVGTKNGSGPLRTGSSDEVRSLILKDFTMKRQFDTWFRGASEFFVKCGSVPGFTSSTEAEMRLFVPTITDFMIVVKRNQVGQTIPFNAMLISDWTEQLESFAFLIVEDDGGTRTSWKAEAIVKVESKSYGVTMEIPFNQRDEIVWRGTLSSRYFDKYAGTPEHFGDVDVTFAIR